MSKDTVVVPGSTVTPEWLEKRKRVMEAIENQIIREVRKSGSGWTLDDLQKLIVQNPRTVSPPPKRDVPWDRKLVYKCYRKLRERLSWSGAVDPLPKTATQENIARWSCYNLRLVFLPEGDITEEALLPGYTKPEKWFYDQIREYDAEKQLGLPPDSLKLKRGWYLADFTVGAYYTDGTQLYVNDPLGSLISKLRHADVIGKSEKTPWESRFAITNDEWREKLLPSLMDELQSTGMTFRLERAIEFNAIGNVYDKYRGKLNCWEWWEDAFERCGRLCGGSRAAGGLAHVSVDLASCRCDDIAGRPLGCFV